MLKLIMSMIKRDKGMLAYSDSPIYDQMERDYFKKHGVSIIN